MFEIVPWLYPFCDFFFFFFALVAMCMHTDMMSDSVFPRRAYKQIFFPLILQLHPAGGSWYREVGSIASLAQEGIKFLQERLHDYSFTGGDWKKAGGSEENWNQCHTHTVKQRSKWADLRDVRFLLGRSASPVLQASVLSFAIILDITLSGSSFFPTC